MTDFQHTQDRHFVAADAAHYRWTTEDPAFAPVEDALLGPALAELRFPCLEIGCGEGTNLARLVGRGAAVGIDRYLDKLRFAARVVPAARLVAADALALPFRDGVFAGVLMRDLLHHVSDPRRAAAEAVRVLAPGGTLVVIEPNGRNPLIALQARLVLGKQPAFPDVHPVKGVVKVGGKPAAGGSLRFYPDPDVAGFITSGPVGPDGA